MTFCDMRQPRHFFFSRNYGHQYNLTLFTIKSKSVDLHTNVLKTKIVSLIVNMIAMGSKQRFSPCLIMVVIIYWDSKR